ncbi:Uncharacterised protein r2_g773 [Pycnogonum litorale]
MKALARSFVWWPRLDSDIEDVVRSCETCVDSHINPRVAPQLFWPWATEPWQRIHVDFTQINSQNFLLVVDTYSKWLEVVPMSNTTASSTVSGLRKLYATYGLPERVVSDNGPQSVSDEFRSFHKMNCIEHIRI